MYVRRFWALGRELEAWVSGWPCCAWRGLWQVHCTPLPGGVPAAGLGFWGNQRPASPVPGWLLGLSCLFLVAAAIRAQDTGWPRSSSHLGGACLSHPATLTFYSLGSRPGKGTEGTEGLLQGRRRVRPQLLQTLLPRPWISDPRAVLTRLCSQALTPRLGAGSTDQPALGATCSLHSASSLLTVLGAPSSPGPTPEVRVSSPSLSKSDLGNLSTFF